MNTDQTQIPSPEVKQVANSPQASEGKKDRGIGKVLYSK
jgi:hypothetical protein